MRIAIIGGGSMGGALVEGLIKKQDFTYKYENIIISNPHLEKIKRFEKEGVKITISNKDAVQNADVIIVAVKPWKVREVIEEIETVATASNAEWCFIEAGITSTELSEMFRNSVPENFSIVMPNTAMSQCKSMTFIVPAKGKFTKTESIFTQVGRVQIIEEKQLPAAMALASCGIAFALKYIRASCLGGITLGFKPSEAQSIVCATIDGAISLLNHPDAHAEVEIDKVTTPGGITIKGLNEMEKYGFSTAVIEALKVTGR
ncbi:MAG: NAD(P)-binding domain-containing protein [Muribaculaceae bacterium]|nr:NAD(P)-binding domain-containing protein [Muribaculaceae bacterium]